MLPKKRRRHEEQRKRISESLVVAQHSSSFCHRRMNAVAWLGDHKQHRLGGSSLGSPLWPPSHRWHSHAPPSPTQTPNAAFLFSAKHKTNTRLVKNTVWNLVRNKCCWWVMSRRTFSISAPSVSLSISCSMAVTFWLIWWKTTQKENDAMERETGCNNLSRQWSGIWPASCFLLNLNTYLFELSLRHLQLHPPARLLLLYAALEALKDSLLWMQKEWHFSIFLITEHRIILDVNTKDSSHRLCQNLLVRLAVFL